MKKKIKKNNEIKKIKVFFIRKGISQRWLAKQLDKGFQYGQCLCL